MGPDRIRGWWQGLGRWGQWAAAAWVLVFVVTSVRVVVSNPRTHSDYLTFANTARNWVAGKGLYCQFDKYDFFDDFRYSPLVAVSLVPFSAFPDRVGNVLWRLVNVGILLAALTWWGKKALTPAPSPAQLAILILLVLPLAIGNVNNGQSNPLVLGLLLAAVAAVTDQRWNWTSVFVALAILFKIYPIAVGLLLVAIYPRQLGVRLVVALAAGLALPFLLQNPAYVAEQYRIWIHYLIAEDRQTLPLAATYRDVRLFFRALSMPLSPQAYLAVQLAAAAGAALLCLAGKNAGWSQRRLLTLLTGLGCIWMTAFGVATESCTYVLVAPTGAWAVMQVRLEKRSFLVQGFVLGSYGLLVIAQMANWFKGAAHFHALGVQALGCLLLLVGLLAAEVRRPASRYPLETDEPCARPQAA